MHVEPVVVLWGGGVRDWPEGERTSQLDGVTVLRGHTLLTWAPARCVPALNEEQVTEVWRALDAQVARRDPVDDLAHPVPASLELIAARIGLVFLFGVFGLLFIGEVFRRTDTWALTLAVGAASVVPAVLLIRHSVARPAAWGWLIGAGLPVVALSVAEVIDLLVV